VLTVFVRPTCLIRAAAQYVILNIFYLLGDVHRF
jgi:hypothetical protein